MPSSFDPRTFSPRQVDVIIAMGRLASLVAVVDDSGAFLIYFFFFLKVDVGVCRPSRYRNEISTKEKGIGNHVCAP